MDKWKEEMDIDNNAAMEETYTLLRTLFYERAPRKPTPFTGGMIGAIYFFVLQYIF
jgi:hypothetical protein